jgi:predicted MPP superfamily phosphohydrolase
MRHVLIFLATVGALLVLLQWFSFVSIRKYLFQRDTPLSRKVAYPVLAGLAGLNYIFIKLSFGSAWLARGSVEQKIAGVAFFSYLGTAALLGLFFAWLALLAGLWYVKDALVNGIRARRPGIDSEERARPARAALACAEASVRHTPIVSEFPVGCKAETGPLCAAEQQPSSCRDLNARKSDVPRVTRRSFLKWTSAAGLGCTAGFVGFGLAEAYGKPVVEEFDVVHTVLAGLHRPISVIQISDFHFGLFYGVPELEKLVDQVNAIEADVLVITGDVFHSPLSVKQDAARALSRLSSRRFGNFAVLGNHDFYAGVRESVEYIEKSGVRLLRDGWTTLKERGVRIHLGGIDDPMGSWLFGKEFPRFGLFTAKTPSEPGMRILLSHRPAVLPFASRADIDLVLAGHIHGGQIIMPVPSREQGVSLARLVSPYTYGWYREGSCRLYLNRGVGLTFIPWRVNCPPEITVFHLKPPPGGNAPDERG